MTCSRIFIPLVVVLLSVLGVLSLWASAQVSAHEREMLSSRRELVKRLHLTDLAVWTEARYARHPSQADLFTAFQEFPGAPEHFPSGSLMAPPPLNLNTTIRVAKKSGVAR